MTEWRGIKVGSLYKQMPCEYPPPSQMFLVVSIRPYKEADDDDDGEFEEHDAVQLKTLEGGEIWTNNVRYDKARDELIGFHPDFSMHHQPWPFAEVA